MDPRALIIALLIIGSNDCYVSGNQTAMFIRNNSKTRLHVIPLQHGLDQQKMRKRAQCITFLKM